MANIGEGQILDIARVVHGATRAYGNLFGKMWEPSWDEASGWHRAAVIAGVKAVVSGEANSPEELHAARTRAALDTAGPFADLSIEQRRRTALFRAIVLALVDGPCEGDCHDPGCSLDDRHACHLETCLSEFGVPRAEHQDLQDRSCH
jgi:hypothetical protein